jgi:signal transduction histidine kinase
MKLRGPRSIALRLTIFVSLAVIVGWISTWPFLVYVDGLLGLDDQTHVDALGLNHAVALVQQSVRRDETGVAEIAASPELRDYQAQNPGFRFAVFSDPSGDALPGSDEDLVDAIRDDRRRAVFTRSLHVPGDAASDPQFWMTDHKTPLGRLPLAVYGYRFHWADLLYIARDELFDLGVVAYAPGVILAVAAVWFGVWRGLAPLGAAARRLQQIDFDALDRRLDLSAMPLEIAPFAQAVNNTLERLEAGVALQQRFIANAAHELRTPITILCAHADNSEDANLRKDVRRDAFRLKMIVQQLLASATLSKRRGACDAEIELGQAILEMILDYMPLAVENGRKIELEAPPQRVLVRSDRRAIESVVANLIDNALRAEPKGGTVLVRIDAEGGVAVVDHGAGVAPQDREKIFEPFWRKAGAKYGGAGLGLSIVKEMIEKVGGRVWFEDTPGGGATFRLAFRNASRE